MRGGRIGPAPHGRAAATAGPAPDGADPDLTMASRGPPPASRQEAAADHQPDILGLRSAPGPAVEGPKLPGRTQRPRHWCPGSGAIAADSTTGLGAAPGETRRKPAAEPAGRGNAGGMASPSRPAGGPKAKATAPVPHPAWARATPPRSCREGTRAWGPSQRSVHGPVAALRSPGGVQAAWLRAASEAQQPRSSEASAARQPLSSAHRTPWARDRAATSPSQDNGRPAAGARPSQSRGSLVAVRQDPGRTKSLPTQRPWRH